MAILNGYTTLAAVKNLLDIKQYDAVDDAVLNDLINKASRFIDSPKGAGRRFYPRIETRKYDAPTYRSLLLDDDLLAVVSITNGNGDAILPAEYILDPANTYPKYSIRLKQSSSYYWQGDSSGNSEQVISVNAWWGFRQFYTQRAWAQVGTLAAAIATDSVLTATLTAGHSAVTGQIWKIESEILNGSVDANTMTFQKRGDNGSTAATHVITTPVYAWQPEEDIELACQTIAKNLFHNRSGQNTDGVATITGAGVVITPRDIPALTMTILQNYRRLS